MDTFVIDPDEVKDFVYPWADRLLAGETVEAYTIEATDGITVDSHSLSGSDVTVWLSHATRGTRPQVTCHVITDEGRRYDYTLRFVVEDS